MSDTPRTDFAREVYASWTDYAKKYGHIQEAMEQAPKYADPFEIAEELERELAAANEARDLFSIAMIAEEKLKFAAERDRDEWKRRAEEVREVVQDFIDTTIYEGEQDDAGRRACCRVLSYKPHEPNCKAAALLARLIDRKEMAVSDTTISRCPSCNQEMHPSDYLDRLHAHAEFAAVNEALATAERNGSATMDELGEMRDRAESAERERDEWKRKANVARERTRERDVTGGNVGPDYIYRT